jgi:hypothetical protein
MGVFPLNLQLKARRVRESSREQERGTPIHPGQLKFRGIED